MNMCICIFFFKMQGFSVGHISSTASFSMQFTLNLTPVHHTSVYQNSKIYQLELWLFKKVLTGKKKSQKVMKCEN